MVSLLHLIENNHHPFSVVERLRQRYRRLPMTFEYSIYVPGPPGITIARETACVEAQHISKQWIENLLIQLPPHSEVAWHSRVLRSGRVFHIPMVDFTGRRTVAEIGSKMNHLLDQLDGELLLFQSGSSLHGYVDVLLDELAWQRYLGKLLLLNPSGVSRRQVVDCRWVGHSLEHGFSALRWSCNSGRYRMLPRLVRRNVTNRTSACCVE